MTTIRTRRRTTRTQPKPWDVLVIGSGPAGQKAAVQASKAGRRVAIVERDRDLGGQCVHRGTIPSKTLRELALQAERSRRLNAGLPTHVGRSMEALMDRLSSVVRAHVNFMTDQMSRNNIVRIHGEASFLDRDRVTVRHVDGSRSTYEAKVFIIATGSKPRLPEELPVDHEHIFDSDSILSVNYIPETLLVLGGGVIACEYAAIFAQLGTRVTLVDAHDRPLVFMDVDLVDRFVGTMTAVGSRMISGQQATSLTWDGVSHVTAMLTGGKQIRSEKALVALGRLPNTKGLGLERTGVEVTKRGHVVVDEHCRTNVPTIYAAGDVIGPPALAATSMEQGRRAVCHALGLPLSRAAQIVPTGVYTIPEMSSVGLTAEQAEEKHGSDVWVGRAQFNEVARGQIAGVADGLLKLVCVGRDAQVVGVHVVGDGASELVHLGQVAIAHDACAGFFVDEVFNFPTLAEAYRIAAFDALKRRSLRFVA